MSKKKFSLVELQLSRNMQDIVNMIANIMSFVITLIISFFISPYIVKNLGAEANGFVTLANNFVSYATLIKTALNSIGSRYIILAYHQNDYEKANKYYSSLFFGDLILSIVFSVLSFVVVWQLQNIINVSDRLVTDVKLLFSLIFANFIFSTVTTIFGSAPYIKNKIYLQSIRDIQSSFIRAIVLVVLFSLFSPKVFFLGLSTLIPGIIVILYNIYYKTRLVPELKVSKKNFSWKAIKELVSQGIWNSISSVGTMLLTSLDLLIANLFVSEKDMGILSVAKSMPNVVTGLGGTLASVFFSAMMIDYSHNDIKALIRTVKKSTMLIGSIVTIPLSFLIAFGSEFYSLWQPTMDAKQLQILSILTCMGFILYAGVNSVGTIFTVTVHVKERSLATVLTGIISIVITLILVKYTNLGIYAIAGVSSVVNTIQMIGYVVPQGARYIGQKWNTFLPVVFKSLTSTILLCLLGIIIKLVIPTNTWLCLIMAAGIFAVIGFILNMFVVMDKEFRVLVMNTIKGKIRKGRTK